MKKDQASANHRQYGFTLLELMVVVSIIGVLAAIAIPQFNSYRDRAFRAEAFSLFAPIREDISAYYDHTGRLPENNEQCGLPAPELIKGKSVVSVTVHQGSVRVLFNDRIQGDCHNSHLEFLVVAPGEKTEGNLSWEFQRCGEST